MRRPQTSNSHATDAFLTRYVEAYGENILSRHISTIAPAGWTNIIIRMFSRIKRYHPGAKITAFHVEPSSSWGNGRFDVQFRTLDMKDTIHKAPKLPNSLKWILIQAKKEAFSTCERCGHPLGKGSKHNLCALCALRHGTLKFNRSH
ncbi:hypothetical protein [Desulfovibrio sp. Huiquan2017]|uniref:hypothetical protein n=1 Tax=Desulfovibrio sp. Huiquan2017 TaxID=2816861 RepID=UPI001A9225B6|nr:hypothetical protein [Desulfovibrio sp. Huiquan2017]